MQNRTHYHAAPMSKRTEILQLLKLHGPLRARDLEQRGYSGAYLRKLYQQGELDRPARGLYAIVNDEPTEHRSLLEAHRRVPRATICLLSALRFHNLTTEAPFEVWMAATRTTRTPTVDYPAIRLVRMSGKALSYGIEHATIESQKVPVYSIAKTLADCFKFRNQIGLDVAVEALREALTGRHVTIDEVWRAAAVCRQSNTMRPYMEAMV